MSYSPIETDAGTNKNLLSEEESAKWGPDEKVKTMRFPSWWKVILYPIVLAIVFTFGGLAGYRWNDIDGLCSHHVSQYSPLFNDVDIKYHVEEFNGEFINQNIYRQDASPEVDAAWEALGTDYRPLRVPPEDGEKSGISSDHVKINDEYGGGYPANLEGLHHLHCLNLLRKSLYYNYDYYHERGEGAFVNADHVVRIHVSHCLDILRQQLMCTIDTGVLGRVWVFPDEPTPFVDFNTKHKCKNFDAIRQWAEDNQLPEQPPTNFIQQLPKKGERVYKEIP
ncbi:oxidase ustYa family protein [Aspergillus melleus]|uniref:oxidase ustYa family protein n=1 Tax=Aspergillus melleus TaxID=138277 RepID=UPI001E8D0BAD|nr:uncharacterized protein LDX57_010554 [Aspergillus melleus]KAH8432921.1 hypothetical protein LDX57_010554 [Aspergillus melleus]